MNPASQTIPSPSQVIQLLATHKRYWLIPAVVLGTLAALYAVVRPSTWEASQALIVRDEAANNELGPGKFDHADEMKTVQETILELAKGRSVLTAALKQVGQPAGSNRDEAAWPNPREVDSLRQNVKLTPPKGAEFGKTEIFYLKVRDHDNDRAVALNRAICDRLQARFQDLRDDKAQSMTDELVKTVHLAKADLDDSTARLREIEKQVGSDLAELRVLNEPGSGDSALHQTITEIRSELRQIAANREANEQLLELLQEAQEDPGRLVATPNRLLDSQPALRRLQDGLVDAQLRTATLKGTMSEAHPLVRSAMQAEEEIGGHLHNELAIALRGLKAELQVNGDRQAALENQLADAGRRLGELAELRAVYSNQLAETANRSQLVERAEQNLAEARASHASAKAASLISRIDSPETGVNPIGPRRAMIVLMGIAGGLLGGLGFLLLTVQPPQPTLAGEAAAARVQPKRAESQQPAPRQAAMSLPSGGLGFGPIAPVLHPGGNLSVKQALQKIVYGNAV